PGRLELAPAGRELGRGEIVLEVGGFDVDVRRAERLHHLDRPGARELAERVAGHAEAERFGGGRGRSLRRTRPEGKPERCAGRAGHGGLEEGTAPEEWVGHVHPPSVWSEDSGEFVKSAN